MDIKGLRRAERATLQLRSLYENYGYRKYRMGRFEEYSLYAVNKKFLLSENVITFTDLDGRLMALKPDITLGIAKNTKPQKGSCEKVYYIENVYRDSKESHTFREISQMGLECIGAVDDFAITEVLALAEKSLESFEIPYILKLTNMDFVVGLLAPLDLDEDTLGSILKEIRRKSRSGIDKACKNAGFAEELTEKIKKIPDLYGSVESVIPKAMELADTEELKATLERILNIEKVLKSMGKAGHIRLDFSMINDTRYYNGIVFQGYLDGLARPLLSGGQYDGMMDKLGKREGAVGFAIYLTELDTLAEKMAEYDTEALIIYDENTDFEKLAEAAQTLRGHGLSVRTEKAIPADLRYRTLYKFENGNLVMNLSREGKTC